MLRSIQLEWMKFRKNIVFRMMTLAYLVLLPSMHFIGKEVSELPPPLPSNKIFFEFPTVWDFLGYNGNWQVFFFFGFLSVFMITSEFANKTLRQNIISGIERHQYFTGKLAFYLIICVLATLYFAVCALGIGWMNTSEPDLDLVFKNAAIVPRYLVMTMGYMSFGMLLGLLLRRTGLALFLFFTYILFLEPFLRWVVHSRLFGATGRNLYPMNAIEDLAPLPFYKMLPDFGNQDGKIIELVNPETAVMVSLIYIVLFVSIGYWHFRRSDL